MQHKDRPHIQCCRARAGGSLGTHACPIYLWPFPDPFCGLWATPRSIMRSIPCTNIECEAAKGFRFHARPEVAVPLICFWGGLLVLGSSAVAKAEIMDQGLNPGAPSKVQQLAHACLLCMHAYYVCMHTMHACILCMHAYHACMCIMHVCMHIIHTCMYA